MKKIIVEKLIYQLQDLFDSKVSEGDYLEYNGELYIFNGYDFGTYPLATHIETGEQIKLPHY
jgi:hypothetical protein